MRFLWFSSYALFWRQHNFQWCYSFHCCVLKFICTFVNKYWKLSFWHWSFTFNSNKSPTWCNNFSVYNRDVCLQLNMFRAFSRPSSGVQWLQRQPLVLPHTVVIVVLCSWSGWPAGRPDHKHSMTITMIRRWNQRLPLQSLSSWWWAGKRPKHVEL
jgi:hypothetical protein